MHRLGHSIPSAKRKGRGSTFVVYVLRDSKGRPLYIGYSGNFTQRVKRHLAGPDQWRRNIDRWNCCQLRWCKDRAHGLRIERRRIRAATVLARWRFIPPLHNDAEVDTERVWFPRLWALIYLVEGALCAPCRLAGPVLGAVRDDGPSPESPAPQGQASSGAKLRAEYSRPVRSDGTGGSVAAEREPDAAHETPPDPSEAAPESDWVDPTDADADSVPHTPTGCGSPDADADADHPARPEPALGDLEAFVTTRRAPIGTENPQSGQAARTAGSGRAGTGGRPAAGAPDRRAYNRAQKARRRAELRGGG